MDLLVPRYLLNDIIRFKTLVKIFVFIGSSNELKYYLGC